MNITQIGTNKSRIHCRSNGYRQRNSAEHEGDDGALTEKGITENNITNADNGGDRILEKILSSENLNKAYKQVKKNKGAHGGNTNPLCGNIMLNELDRNLKSEE